MEFGGEGSGSLGTALLTTLGQHCHLRKSIYFRSLLYSVLRSDLGATQEATSAPLQRTAWAQPKDQTTTCEPSVTLSKLFQVEDHPSHASISRLWGCSPSIRPMLHAALVCWHPASLPSTKSVLGNPLHPSSRCSLLVYRWSISPSRLLVSIARPWCPKLPFKSFPPHLQRP